MLEWLKQHVADGCRSGRDGSCVLCSLKETYDQMLSGTVGRAPAQPVIAQRRHTVAGEFRRGQHDAVDFMERFLDRAKGEEVERQRYGLWGGVQQTHPVATQVDRLFGHVQETRRQCTSCRGAVRSWYASDAILRVSPVVMDGGPLTMSELYLSSCAVGDSWMVCPQCQCETKHRTQVRMMTAPNVLAIQVRREPGPRVPVAVEQQLDLPGFPLMELIGVVYHNGGDFHSGHYTCVCRGPGGRFWSYDDAPKPVHREDRDVSHIKPRQVVLVVYGRADGGATMTSAAAEAAENAAVGIDEAVAVLDAEPQNVPSSSSGQCARRLRRKTSSEVPPPVQDASSEVPPPAQDSPLELEGGIASTPTRTPAASLVMSPPSRRLRRKTSAPDASVPESFCAGSSPASGSKRNSDEALEATPDAAFASPCLRRLRRKASAEAAAVVASPVAALPSPSSRRLQRKTSAVEASPSASMAAESVMGSVATSVAVECAQDRTGSIGDVARDVAGGGRAADALGRGRVMTTLKRGRGRGRQAGSQMVDAGVGSQEDAAAWFLAAADIDGGSGVVDEPRSVVHSGSAPVRRQGVVSGFGAERTDDALGDQAQRDREALSRARARRDDGVRGRFRDFQGNDLDRSAGGAWSLGRR